MRCQFCGFEHVCLKATDAMAKLAKKRTYESFLLGAKKAAETKRKLRRKNDAK